MTDELDAYRDLPPGDRRTEALVQAGRADVRLMVEFLEPEDVRPDWREATWVSNSPCGFSVITLRRIQNLQKDYGFQNVTTGDPKPVQVSDGTRWIDETPCRIGLYVRTATYQERMGA